MNGQKAFVEKERESLAIVDFPFEVMLIIFKYCSDRSLCNLSETCKYFHRLINDFVWQSKSRNCLVTNQISEEICIRSRQMLLGSTKRRISINWAIGRYKESVAPSRERHMPWLLLDSSNLWMTKGKTIEAYHRNADGLNKKPYMILAGHNADVCRSAMTEGLIVSGGRDGTICGWSAQEGDLKFRQEAGKNQDIRAVDIRNNVVVSGSSSGTVSVWKLSEENWSCDLAHKINVADGIWSVAAERSIFCVGTSGLKEAPLHLYNMEQGRKIKGLHACQKYGAGVLDIHWETPYTFLSAGYDTYIRLWDIRTGMVVLVWEDPYDSTVYCISSDNMYTILSGTASHGRVQLWDKRHRRSVQKYFMRVKHSSPVYSLVFDPCNLYAALDTSLNLLDFSIYKDCPEAVIPSRKWTSSSDASVRKILSSYRNN